MFVLFLCRPIVLLSLYITPKQQQRLKALSRNDGIEEFTVDWEYLLMLLLYSKLLLLRMVFSAGQYKKQQNGCTSILRLHNELLVPQLISGRKGKVASTIPFAMRVYDST